MFDAGVDGRRRVCAGKRFTGLAWAGIPGGNSQYERKPMSKIIYFLGLDVHRETVVRSIVPERDLRRCGWPRVSEKVSSKSARRDSVEP